MIKGAGFLAVIFIPIALMSGFFAFPWKLNQPTEVWALAKIRFILKPRQRKWDQSGTKEVVEITAPKQVVTDYTKGLSQVEIQSRLKTLAKTIDTRGWAIKNLDNPATIIPNFRSNTGTADRLIDIEKMPIVITPTDTSDAEDILDDNSSLIAHNFDKIIASSADIRKKNLIESLNAQSQSPAPIENIKPEHTFVTPETKDNSTTNWFLNPANGFRSNVAPAISQVRTTNASTTQAVTQVTPSNPVPQKVAAPTIAYSPYADILNLASNNDLNIATLARRVNLKQNPTSGNEVVINLR
jgi:hypothetical protein